MTLKKILSPVFMIVWFLSVLFVTTLAFSLSDISLMWIVAFCLVVVLYPAIKMEESQTVGRVILWFLAAVLVWGVGVICVVTQISRCI